MFAKSYRNRSDVCTSSKHRTQCAADTKRPAGEYFNFAIKVAKFTLSRRTTKRNARVMKTVRLRAGKKAQQSTLFAPHDFFPSIYRKRS